MKFPDHYPPACPPQGCTDVGGEIYRCVKNKPPSAADFVSHYHRYGKARFSTEDLCQACGLSVFISETDIKRARQMSSFLRRMRIAKGRLAADWGKIAPSESRLPNHHTWWVADGKKPEILFDIVEVK